MDIIAEAAGKEIEKEHDLSKPQGDCGRNSDNSLLREVLGWDPQVDLEEEDITETYAWIWEQFDSRGRAAKPEPVTRASVQAV